jgi:hypothetical protein
MVLDSEGRYAKPAVEGAPFSAQHVLLEHYAQPRND